MYQTHRKLQALVEFSAKKISDSREIRGCVGGCGSPWLIGSVLEIKFAKPRPSDLVRSCKICPVGDHLLNCKEPNLRMVRLRNLFFRIEREFDRPPHI